MKSKYLVYLVIVSLVIKIGIRLSIPYLAQHTKIDPFNFGLIGGGVDIIAFLSIVGLLIKIFRYENKSDFLDS